MRLADVWYRDRWERWKGEIRDNGNLCGAGPRPILDPDIARLVVIINANPDLETTESCQGHGSFRARQNPSNGDIVRCSAYISFLTHSELDVFELMTLEGGPDIEAWLQQVGRGWLYRIYWNMPNSLEGIKALEQFFLERGAVAPDFAFVRELRKMTPAKWFRKK